METFERPDIAEGIFYEYLRHDDPISPELRDRVVDGFPFLLGPLAQVKGVNIGKSAMPKPSGPSHHSVFDLVGGFADAVRSHSIDMAGAAKRSAVDAAVHAGAAAKEIGGAAMDLAKELDRRKDVFVKVTVATPSTALKLLARDPEIVGAFAKWMAAVVGKEPEISPEEEVLLISPTRRAPRGRVFGYPLSRWFGEDYHAPDEIGPLKIHPTINKIILALVHLYLLLLFIVSFPGSYSTRTKLVVRRSCKSRESSDSESDTSCEEINGKECFDEVTNMNMKQERRDSSSQRRKTRLRDLRTAKSDDLADEITSTGLKKKSLSYFL